MDPETFSIRPEPITSEAATRLLAALTEELSRRYDHCDDGSGHFQLSDLDHPRSIFLVGQVGNRLVACAALRPFDELTAEVKRMFVIPEMRGRGYSREMLGELENRARNFGYSALRLETGDKLLEAIQLYESSGFHRIAGYGPFIGNVCSICFEKAIEIRN